MLGSRLDINAILAQTPETYSIAGLLESEIATQIPEGKQRGALRPLRASWIWLDTIKGATKACFRKIGHGEQIGFELDLILEARDQ